MTRRVKTHIRLGIRSVFPSDQSPRCPHGETLLTYLPIAKFHGVSPRNFAEKTLGEISDFYFSPRKKLFRIRGVPRRNAKKELFSWADLYLQINVNIDCWCNVKASYRPNFVPKERKVLIFTGLYGNF